MKQPISSMKKVTMSDTSISFEPVSGAVSPRFAGVSTFMRLLGLAFSQSQGHLRKYLSELYGRAFQRYMQLVLAAAPQLPARELFWRVHFMLGSAAFTMSSLKALRAIAESEFEVHTGIDDVLKLMVPFLAAGMRAGSGMPGLSSDPVRGARLERV